MMDPCAPTPTRPEAPSAENTAKARNRPASPGGPPRPTEERLDHAPPKPSREDGRPQENARPATRREKQQPEFPPGEGESNTEAPHGHGGPRHVVRLPSFNSPVERLPSGVLVPSLENPAKVIKQMFSWREMTKGLKSCLERAQNGFSREPQCIQDNTKMVVKSDGRVLVFMSGEGANTINVFQLQHGSTQYTVDVPGWWDKIVRRFTVTNG